MKKSIASKQCVEQILETTGFAVLATESGGTPHTSLIAFTVIGGWRQLIFATYRDTRKYSNLMQNDRVSILVDGRHICTADDQQGFVVTAIGKAQDIVATELTAAHQAHLTRHPDLAAFMQSPDCVLLGVVVEAYQVVRGIDDVVWWSANDLASAR
ncbi:MAG: pyridoxamine 5'-phosphate oxidase family protein [Rhodoferax sp.]|nr:pyridoxamine 5'-phosphate oxidase family protein [Rhodoferax sp.]